MSAGDAVLRDQLVLLRQHVTVTELPVDDALAQDAGDNLRESRLPELLATPR